MPADSRMTPTDPRREAFEKALDELVSAERLHVQTDLDEDAGDADVARAAVVEAYREAREDARRLDSIAGAMGISGDRLRSAIDNGEKMGLAFMRQSAMRSRAALYAGWTLIGEPFRPADATDKGESNG